MSKAITVPVLIAAAVITAAGWCSPIAGASVLSLGGMTAMIAILFKIGPGNLGVIAIAVGCNILGVAGYAGMLIGLFLRSR